MDRRPYPAAMSEQAPPAAAAPTRPRWLLLAVAGLVVLVLVLGGVAAWALMRKPAAAVDAASSAASSAVPIVGKPHEEAPEPRYYTPTEIDFKLTVKITRKKCFGSAGCNVTYHVNLAYAGDAL